MEFTSAIVSTHFIARKLNVACWARISWLADTRVVYTLGEMIACYGATDGLVVIVEGLTVVTIVVTIGVHAGALGTWRMTLAFVYVCTRSENSGLES